MSQINCLPRPPFWKVPEYTNNNMETRELHVQILKPPTPTKPALACRGSKPRYEKTKKHVRFKDFDDYYHPSNNVQVGSPAFGEVLRGDIISKIGDYDARDLSHADAQTLFRSAGNEISIVVHRDNKIAYTQGLSGDSSRSNSALLSTSPDHNPHRGPSPILPGPGHYERALQVPVDTLPHTVFPNLNASGGYVAPSDNGSFSPMPTRDHLQDVAEEQVAIVNQQEHFNLYKWGWDDGIGPNILMANV